jgi:hypothetical protein
MVVVIRTSAAVARRGPEPEPDRWADRGERPEVVRAEASDGTVEA